MTLTSSQTAAACLTLTLFGPMRALVQGQPLLPMHSRKGLWLLALLALRHDRPVEREWLAGTLWPDSDQSRAFSNLRVVLSELRGRLGDQSERLQSPDRHTVRLDLAGAEVDVVQFDRAIKSAKLSELEHAVALYRGPLLEGCAEEWVFQERAAREQSYLQALQRLGDASLTGKEYVTAAGYYQQMVRLDPWQEAARRGWMEALAKHGDVNAALQVYREFVAFLKDDPKATPDVQTSALYQRLRDEAHRRAGPHTAVTQAVVMVEAAPVSRIKGYLSHPLTELVGREDEQMEVALLLRRSRLLTLTGVGGIGKTRLAQGVAGEVVGEYGDGVWLVALESLTEGRLVIQQIASVLELREERGRTPLQSVIEHLRKKRLLLVLDNCEHLLQASAEVAAYLLQECEEVRILATSREALGITGEVAWSVPALAVPDTMHLPQRPAPLLRVLMGYESVQLFVERAQAVQKTFALSGSNALAVAQVCQQLEGIPLAIELAAARIKVLTVGQIAARLDNELSLLTGGNRAAQSRQQTLRATLDWSYDLLTEAERLLLRRLSVFAGGCLLEAAEAVCTDTGKREEGSLSTLPSLEVLDLLTSLVDKSLVQFEEWQGAAGRYRLLEMVRQYAAEGLQKSGEIESIKRRHRDWFLAFAEAAELQLRGAEQAKWLQQLETEHNNLRAALAFSETDALGAEAALRLVGALYWFWFVRGDFNEGRAYLSRALEREEAQEATAARAKALNGAGDLAYSQGDNASARVLCEESLTIFRELGDQEGIATSLNTLGDIVCDNGDYDVARTLLEESLAIWRELGNRWGLANSLSSLAGVDYANRDYDVARILSEESLMLRRELRDQGGIANSLNNLGGIAYYQGDDNTARTLFQESLAIRRELEDKSGIVHTLRNLGSVANRQGNYDAGRTLYEESLAISRELGDKPNIIHALEVLGHVEREIGDYARAATCYQECLLLRREMGDMLATARSLEDFAGLARRQGQFERAVWLLGATEALGATLGHTLPIGNAMEYKRTVAAARSALSEETFAAAWEEGRSMTLEQAVAYALEEAE